jgi:hypothetical protein
MQWKLFKRGYASRRRRSLPEFLEKKLDGTPRLSALASGKPLGENQRWHLQTQSSS